MAPTERETCPRVTVVVLSYDRPALLERAIASVLAQTYPRIEIVVVDNLSASSGRIREVVGRFSSVRLITNDSNLGFTGGMNKGLSEAVGEYVYLTEDDIELDPRCLDELIGYMEQHPAVGLVGPVMYNLRARTVRCAGGHFELNAVYRMTIFGVSKDSRSSLSEPFTVTYLPGSMMCARRALWRQLDGFRDDFFMYAEDVELCVRLFRSGLEVVVVPAAKVLHHEPPAVDGSALLDFHKQKNLAAIYFLHAPIAVLLAFVVRYGVIGFLRRLAGDRSQVRTFLRAWLWVFSNSPRLLAARRGGVGGQRLSPGPAGTGLTTVGQATRQ
jgi:GT2 family glycosyltransferase